MYSSFLIKEYYDISESSFCSALKKTKLLWCQVNKNRKDWAAVFKQPEFVNDSWIYQGESICCLTVEQNERVTEMTEKWD